MITERVSGEKSFYSGKRPTRYAWLTPHWGLGGDRQSRLYLPSHDFIYSDTTLFTRYNSGTGFWWLGNKCDQEHRGALSPAQACD